MLKDVDLNTKLSSEEYESEKRQLTTELVRLQQEYIRQNKSVVICIDGWAGAGKGSTLSKVVKDLDPRAFRVHAMSTPNDGERRYPFMARYWGRIGRHGTMSIFNKSWYTEAFKSLQREMRLGPEADEVTLPHPSLSLPHAAQGEGEAERILQYTQSASMFEQQLKADGYLIIKCFFHVSKEEQQKRLGKLGESEDTAWRVTSEDLWQNEHYDQCFSMIDVMLDETDALGSRWNIIPSDNRRMRRVAFMRVLAESMAAGLESGIGSGEESQAAQKVRPFHALVDAPDIRNADYGLALADDEYRSRLKAAQKRLAKLQNALYRRGIPMMIVFEGWDAAGKGGAIKRVASAFDARDYRVVPSAAPTPDEKERPFLWRYWTNLPKSGHTCMYDRSWYGRVMVERIEGFCTPQEWGRAYDEINDFEWELARNGVLMIKFWIDVSPDEQLRRFEERRNNPDKAWKLTDEDWRNRDKREEYLEAIDDMFRKTSTEVAPWHLVESDDKKYARVKVIETMIDAIEARLEK